MKKSVFILNLVIIVAVLGGCFSSQFDGSRTGNESQLIMEYKVLNKMDSQELELQEGDYVDVIVSSVSGKVDIRLQREGEEPVYSGTDVPTSTFAVKIKDTGIYIASVTGEKARGSVSMIRREVDQTSPSE